MTSVARFAVYQAKKHRKEFLDGIIDQLAALFSKQVSLGRRIEEHVRVRASSPVLNQKESGRSVIIANLEIELEQVEKEIAELLMRAYQLGVDRNSLASKLYKKGISQESIPER